MTRLTFLWLLSCAAVLWSPSASVRRAEHGVPWSTAAPEQGTPCSADARALVDSAIAATMRGAYVDIDPFYTSGADTLGFYAAFGCCGTPVMRAAVRCLTSGPTRAVFELTWTADTAASAGRFRARGTRTITDTISVSQRWVVSNLNFTIGMAWAPLIRRNWPLSEADRRFVDSVMSVHGDLPTSPTGATVCPDRAYAVLREALVPHGSLDTIGFLRAEALGDTFWLVADMRVRCLSSAPTDARFRVSQLVFAQLLPTEDGARLERHDKTVSTTVSLSFRWVIDDLRPFVSKVGRGAASGAPSPGERRTAPREGAL